MKNTIKYLIYAIFIALAFASCKKDSDDDVTPQSVVRPDDSTDNGGGTDNPTGCDGYFKINYDGVELGGDNSELQLVEILFDPTQDKPYCDPTYISGSISSYIQNMGFRYNDKYIDTIPYTYITDLINNTDTDILVASSNSGINDELYFYILKDIVGDIQGSSEKGMVITKLELNEFYTNSLNDGLDYYTIEASVDDIIMSNGDEVKLEFEGIVIVDSNK